MAKYYKAYGLRTIISVHSGVDVTRWPLSAPRDLLLHSTRFTAIYRASVESLARAMASRLDLCADRNLAAVGANIVELSVLARGGHDRYGTRWSLL